MSYLKDLSESHHAIKLISITLFLAPFWYVAIYLFNNEFYLAADIMAVIVFCCTISSTSSFIYMMYLNPIILKKKDNDHEDDLMGMIATVFILIFWLSFLIFICYSVGFLFNKHMYFYGFILLYLSPLAILFLRNLLVTKEKKK